MAGIIVKETVVEKDPTIISEVVALPGIKGEKGDPFTYDDFTPEQIAELQRPATEAAAVANAAAQRAEAAAESVQGAVEDAEQASQSAQQAATEAQEAVTNANTTIGKAEIAINNANTAAETANTAVESVNKLETRVEQAESTRVQSEKQRQTAETNRAKSEQQREANETQRQEKFAQIESDATTLKNSLNEAEAQRVSAENAREEAETQRETAEQNRETEFSEIKTEAETLISQTTEAKNAATEAATSATNAAGAANTAAGLANEAAENANQAAESIENMFSGKRMGRIYLKYNRTQQQYIVPIGIWAEEDYIYLAIWGESILCLSWNGELIWVYRLWCTTGKTITVKGDYLYQFGNNNGTIYKINRYTGKTELSNKNDSVSYSEQKNKIYNVNGTIYCFSAISKSLYTLNENTLELVDTGLYSGEISGCDINVDFITICAQNKLMKFSTELEELSSFDYSEKVTLLKDKDVFIYSHECSPDYTFIQPHNSYYTWLASYSGTNFLDNYYLNTKFGRGTSVICLTKINREYKNIPQLLTDNLKTNARVNLLYKDDIAISNNGVCLAGFFLNRNFMCYLSTDYIKIEIL